MSPGLVKLEMPAMTRRMILPDRVLGMSGTIQTFFGRATLPISFSIAPDTFSSSCLLALCPGLRATYISTARPRNSSITGTAAASATSSTVRVADSSSLVPSRCPATLITSSTRPRIRKYPAADGYFRILGRVDDVINVAGHRLGTKELESATITVDEIAEAAAVPVVDELRGRAVEMYVSLKPGAPSEDIEQKVAKAIETEIGKIARPKS